MRRPPLTYAVEHEGWDAVLFARCNSRLLFSQHTALHGSSEAGHLEVCKLLIECQADVNAAGHMCDARSLRMLLKMNAGLKGFYLHVVTLVFFSVVLL